MQLFEDIELWCCQMVIYACMLDSYLHILGDVLGEVHGDVLGEVHGGVPS